MDMSDDGACAGRTRSTDAVIDIALTPGGQTVGDDDADPKVARVLSVDADGNIELEVLQGSVESHHDLLTPA